MSHRIKKVKYLDGYKLSLQFDDKSIKEVDLIDTINRAKGNLFPLKNIRYFKKVTCDGITIVWPNGVDLCPDSLYRMGSPITESKKKQKKSYSISDRIKRSKSKKSARLATK